MGFYWGRVIRKGYNFCYSLGVKRRDLAGGERRIVGGGEWWGEGQ